MSEAGKTIGIFTGVLDVYVARYATEDTTAIPRRCLARRLK